MTASPAAIRFDVEVRAAESTECCFTLDLVCGLSGSVPDTAVLRVETETWEEPESLDRTVEAVVLAIETFCSRNRLTLLEDPIAQVVAGLRPAEEVKERHLDPDVQVAVARAHEAGEGTYRQLAERFRLRSSDTAKHAADSGRKAFGLLGAPEEKQGIRPVPGPPQATDVQRRKYEGFLEFELKDDVLQVARDIIDLDGLDLSEIGSYWGLTVFSSPKNALRLNVGPREVLVIRRNGLARLLLLGDVAAVGGLPDSVTQSPGFGPLPGSYGLNVPLGTDWADLCGNPGVLRQHRALVEASHQRLSNPNWHNPLTDALLLMDNGAG